MGLLTVSVFEVVVLVVLHVLLVKGLTNLLAILVFTLPIAVPGTISHNFLFKLIF